MKCITQNYTLKEVLLEVLTSSSN